MEQYFNGRIRALRVLLSAFVLIIVSLYCPKIHANHLNTIPNGTQLAYYIGFHYYPGYWNGPSYYNNTHWSHWRYIGYGCSRSCLINNWNGYVIRCVKRCY